MLAKDQGLATDSSGQVVKTSTTATTIALVVQTPSTITASTTSTTAIPGTTLEVDQLTTKTIDVSVHEPSQSLSHIKRNQGDYLSISIEMGSSKHAFLLKEDESETLTPFFRLPSILPSRIPSILEEFVVVVATEDLTFVRNLYAADK